jgi:pyruvate carboxylase
VAFLLGKEDTLGSSVLTVAFTVLSSFGVVDEDSLQMSGLTSRTASSSAGD